MGEVSEINPREAVIHRKNKSAFFILPLLGQPSYWYYGLLNCYLGDINNKPELTFKKIFINSESYDSKLLSTKYFNQLYQLEDNTYMYVFDIPKEYEEDYNKFSDGKYSDISEQAKALICKHSGIKPIMNSVVYKVLYKTADQKQKIEDLIGEELPLSAEVYSRPDLDREVYSLLSIKNNRVKIEREDSEREKV
jgi:hypothetical protein